MTMTMTMTMTDGACTDGAEPESFVGRRVQDRWKVPTTAALLRNDRRRNGASRITGRQPRLQAAPPDHGRTHAAHATCQTSPSCALDG